MSWNRRFSKVFLFDVKSACYFCYENSTTDFTDLLIDKKRIITLESESKFLFQSVNL